MKVGDKVITRFGTGFVTWVGDKYCHVKLDGHEESNGFMIDHVVVRND